MADPTEHEKQAKDAVAASIQGDPGAGPARTVPVMCQQISAAARLHKEPKDAVVAVCRGSMNAVLLAGQSVPDASVALLDALPNMSLMMRAGPEDLMSWVMQGIAESTKVAGADVREGVRTKIEEKFMGASAIFDELCRAADAK
jgi:hypothetical protein